MKARIPAVSDGILQHVSASQIKTFRACKRDWYKMKVLGLSQYVTEPMKLGVEGHRYIEDMIREERGEPKLEPAKLSDIVLASIHLARAMVPKGGYAEVSIDEVLKLADVFVHGRLDYWVPNQGEVVDWKFTGDFQNVLTIEEARNSPQTVIYLKYADRIGMAKMTYVYIHTRKVAAQDVSVRLTPEELATKWAELEDIVRDMKEVAKCKSLDYVQCGCRRCAAKAGEEKKEMPAKAEKIGRLELLINAPLLRMAEGDEEFKDLEVLMDERAKTICEKEGATDIRLLSYNRGPGLLAAAFRANPPTGTVVCRSGPVANAVIEALIPLADRVIGQP